MTSDWQRPGRRDRDDGVRVTRTRRTSAILPGLLLLVVIGWLVARTLRSEPPPPPSPAQNDTALPRTVVAASPPVASARDPQVAERVKQRREERQLQRREKSEAPFTLNTPGAQAGIAAFPPPGTKPIKRGIVVPDDFELPEGYVRHYQTTDDGRRLPPILMFHPDFAGLDQNGNPVLVPDDRIVPPELAPPGLEPRTLDENVGGEDRVGRRVHSDSRPSNRRR